MRKLCENHYYNKETAIIAKTCSKCGIEKGISNFRIANKFTGYRKAECRECNAKRISLYRKINKKKTISQQKKYRSRRLYKDKRNRQECDRKKRDPMYKIRINLHTRLWFFVHGFKKSASTMELVGCSLEFLRNHLESKFDARMNWDNYGSFWQIDHRIPCVSFNLIDSEEQKKCFHYSNLQPLEAKENMSKGAKILPQYLNQPHASK